MPNVSRTHRQSAEVKAAMQLAARHVEAAWACLGVVCPDLPTQDKKALAAKVLALCRGRQWKGVAVKSEWDELSDDEQTRVQKCAAPGEKPCGDGQ